MTSSMIRKNATAALAVICFAGVASAAITSRSYVQEGLVAQYDGINNVGHDAAHSNSATTWVDLTGNGNDGTVNAAVAWSAKGWSNATGSIQPVTVGSGLAAAIAAAGKFTAQMTFAPSDYNASVTALLGQNPNSKNQFNIERNKDGYIGFYAGDPVWKRKSSSLRLTGNSWAPITLIVAGGVAQYSFNVYNGMNPNSLARNTVNVTDSTKVLSFAQNCSSVIGGYTGSDDLAFRGTYNAFRLYNRELTEDEIKLNAAVDAVRFNNGDPSSYAILASCSFDDAGYRLYDFTATAGAGGKVRADGAAAASVTEQTSAGTAAAFTAVPDEGYVFQEWTGDTSAIASGSLITPTISVKSASGGSLQAVFRRRGTALDGLVFDLDMQDVNGNGSIDADDKIGNLMKFSASDAADAYSKAWSTDGTYSAYEPGFRTLDVAAPITSFTTNAQTCLYFPQQIVTSDTVFNSRVDLEKCGIMGKIATFFVRFKWDGAVAEANNCNVALLLNGCTDGWWNNFRGYVLTIRTYANKPNEGYLNVAGSQKRTGNWSNPIGTNGWVDCFMSVYPSPTTSGLSNGDIYFCATPKMSNGALVKPELVHYHFDDSAAMTNLQATAATSSALRLGGARNDVCVGASYRAESFRGAIAEVKGWNRLLTEDEMVCVMSGHHGSTFSVGVRNGSADEFAASGAAATFEPATMRWQRMKKSLTASDRTLTISVTVPSESANKARVLEIAPLFDGTGDRCDVTVSANGFLVGTLDLVNPAQRSIYIGGGFVAADSGGTLNIAITRPQGCTGTLSFDAITLLGGWQIGAADDSQYEMTAEGKGVLPTVVVGDPVYKHAQRSLTKVYPVVNLLFDRGEGMSFGPGFRSAPQEYIYTTRFIQAQQGSSQPVHLELNGETIWSNANVVLNADISIPLPAQSMVTGLNRLTWRYDSPTANYVQFDFHRIRLVPPATGTIILIR